MKVSLIGHSYLAEENRKSLTVLAEQVELEVVSPRATRGMLFSFQESDSSLAGEGWIMRLHRSWGSPPLPPFGSPLRSRDLGFASFQPDIIHIEYDPFTPLFLQTLLCARRYAPRAGIVCTIRQNTFTSRGVLLDWAKSAVTRLLVPRSMRAVSGRGWSGSPPAPRSASIRSSFPRRDRPFFPWSGESSLSGTAAGLWRTRGFPS